MFKNPFERFSRTKSPEELERLLQVAVNDIFFKKGVNLISMHEAFAKAHEQNEKRKLGLHEHRIINIVKDAAYANASAIEDSLYGGPEQTNKNIDEEIERVRKDFWASKKK